MSSQVLRVWLVAMGQATLKVPVVERVAGT